MQTESVEIEEKTEKIPEPEWVTEYTDQIIEKFGEEKEINIATGISLSGPVHVGHLREFMTGAVVCNSLRTKGYKVNLFAFADDMDPLKRCYEFLPEDYEQYVGVPLYRIPSNFKDGLSYSDYFLHDFVESLHKLGIDPIVIKSSDMYNSGAYDDTVKRVMQDRTELQDILKSVSGTQKKDIWPYKFICPDCNCSTKTTITQYDTKSGDTEIHCEKCKHDSNTNISTNGGKLMWRFDWPARWNMFNIHAEPVAQDHASKGGSFDTSETILLNYFSKQAPVPLKYAWVKNKINSDLHTRTGVTSVKQLVDSYPVPVIWSMYALPRPSKPILFDFKESLEEETKRYLANEDILENLIPKGISLSPIFKTLDINTIASFVKTGRPLENITVEEREAIQIWVKALAEESPVDISVEDKEFINELRAVLTQTVEWTPGVIKETITQYAKSKEISTKNAAEILYKVLFSSESGPNIVKYFSELPKEEVISKLSID